MMKRQLWNVSFWSRYFLAFLSFPRYWRICLYAFFLSTLPCKTKSFLWSAVLSKWCFFSVFMGKDASKKPKYRKASETYCAPFCMKPLRSTGFEVAGLLARRFFQIWTFMRIQNIKITFSFPNTNDFSLLSSTTAFSRALYQRTTITAKIWCNLFFYLCPSAFFQNNMFLHVSEVTKHTCTHKYWHFTLIFKHEKL